MWTLGVSAKMYPCFSGWNTRLLLCSDCGCIKSFLQEEGVQSHQDKSLFYRKCMPRTLKSLSCGVPNLGLWRVEAGGKAKVYKDFDYLGREEGMGETKWGTQR